MPAPTACGRYAVLLATGRTKEIRHLRPGDAVYGTVRRGAYRRYVRTEVLDHWMVRKPAYRVSLEDGTELITSADHRFLTGRGWKHVTGTEQGPLQRPHLTLNSKLMGTGAFARAAARDAGVQARLPVRHDPRRWPPTDARLSAAERPVVAEQPVSPGADRLRGAGSRSELPRRAEGRDHGASGSWPPPTGIARCTRYEPASRPRSSAIERSHRVAGPHVAGVVQGLPRRDLRCRGLLQPRRPPDLERRSDDNRLDHVLLPPARLALRCGACARGHVDGARPRRPRAAPALLPPDRPGDHAQALDRGPRGEVAEPPEGREHRAARHGAPALRHHDRHRRLHRQRRGEPQLLRAADARVPRLRRGPRLREGDRRQGQRARGPARGARAAVVEARARRAGDEHRPVPVGRGPLQADARDLGGAARRVEPVLDPDEVSAAAARPRPDARDRRADARSARACRCRRSTRRPGARASRTRRIRGRGWRRSGELNRGRDPDGHPDRAADAGHQRRARADRADHRARDRGGRGLDRGPDAVPARLGARDLLRLAALLPARPGAALRAPLRARRVRAGARAAGDRARRRHAARAPRADRARRASSIAAARRPAALGRRHAGRRCARSGSSEAAASQPSSAPSTASATTATAAASTSASAIAAVTAV